MSAYAYIYIYIYLPQIGNIIVVGDHTGTKVQALVVLAHI